MTTYGALLPILQAIAAASRPPGNLEPSHPPGQRISANAYLPSYGQFLRRLASIPPYDPRQDIVTFIQEIRPHWNELKSDPAFLAKVDALTVGNTKLEDFERRGEIGPVPQGLVGSFGDGGFLLRPNQAVPGNGRSVSARMLVDGVNAPGDALLAEVCTSGRATLGVVHALRRFDDVCIRHVAARRVAAQTGTPLSRVLALYREEGNLCVFASSTSLALGIPSGVLTGGSGEWTDARIALADSQREAPLIDLAFRPNLEHLVWLADDTDPFVQALDVPARKDDHVKSLALASGFLAHVIGGDRLAGGIVGKHGNALAFAQYFRDVSAGYWRFSTPSPTLDGAQADARWQHMLGNLELWRTPRIDGGQGPQAVIVAPRKPVELLADVLTEGVRLLRYFDLPRTLMFKDGASVAATAAVSGQPPLPVAIAYLRYNQQHAPDDGGTTAYILATLLRISAYRSLARAPTLAKPLFAAIDAMPGLSDFLEERRKFIATEVSKEKKSAAEAARRAKAFGFNVDVSSPAALIHRAVTLPEAGESPNGERMRPLLHAFMVRPGNADLLWKYIQEVPRAQWSSWTQSRQNATSNRRLTEFYHRVFE